jgi:hypothetical protein
LELIYSHKPEAMFIAYLELLDHGARFDELAAV